jgi:uncharacterized protein YdeI (YjbR/CyaY-like superfamily)
MEITGEPHYFATAKGWRAWLQANHAVEKDVWVIIHKKHSATPSVTFEESTEEALCFGWVDSVMKGIDEAKYALRYTPRKKGSNWSEGNKRRVAELIEQGRMTEPGLAKIDEAKRSGKWDTIAPVPGPRGRPD